MPRQVRCMPLRHSDKTRPRSLVRVLPLLRERRTAMTGAIIGTAIVFFPAAPLFLFMHGKDITIPKGTEITAYINEDRRFEAIGHGLCRAILHLYPNGVRHWPEFNWLQPSRHEHSCCECRYADGTRLGVE